MRFGPQACLLYCDTQDQNDFSSTIGSLQQFDSCHHVFLLILTQNSLLIPWLFLVVGEWKVLILNLEGHILYLFSLHFLLFFCMAMWQKYNFFFPILPLGFQFHLSFFHIHTKFFFFFKRFDVIMVRAVISSLSFCTVDV